MQEKEEVILQFVPRDGTAVYFSRVSGSLVRQESRPCFRCQNNHVGRRAASQASGAEEASGYQFIAGNTM